MPVSAPRKTAERAVAAASSGTDAVGFLEKLKTMSVGVPSEVKGAGAFYVDGVEAGSYNEKTA